MATSQNRAFVTALITSLGSTTDPNPHNPLRGLPKEKRNTLLTLQLLYPNELLPALDLLDRDLVTKLRLQQPREPTTDDQSAQGAATADQTKPPDLTPIYYVRSAQSTNSSTHASKSRFRDPIASTTHYEVRTSSWSCSCPAFAFSAFPPHHPKPSSLQSSSHIGVQYPRVLQLPQFRPEAQAQSQSEKIADQENVDPEATRAAEERNEEWCAGGLANGDGVPICKHLLACVLAERTGLLGGIVKEREVSLEEMVGWAAGWGG